MCFILKKKKYVYLCRTFEGVVLVLRQYDVIDGRTLLQVLAEVCRHVLDALVLHVEVKLRSFVLSFSGFNVSDGSPRVLDQ